MQETLTFQPREYCIKSKIEIIFRLLCGALKVLLTNLSLFQNKEGYFKCKKPST